MERIIILAIVFSAIGILIWKFIKMFRGGGSACACGDTSSCAFKEACQNTSADKEEDQK